ncbi:hypothetical protein [Streptomyces sp. NPDC051001]|uniref:hypothetical protein n=1 Tax=Streptomyces sp. NPDC051001 TaxID=3155795 RepID=UPI00344951C9
MGLNDFDFARPAARLHDIAYAVQYVAPFRDDAECTRRLHHPQPPDRRRRLEVFCTAYGLSSTEGIVDAVIREQQDTIERVRRAELDLMTARGTGRAQPSVSSRAVT